MLSLYLLYINAKIRSRLRMWAKFGNLCKPKVKRGNFNNLYVRLRTHVDIKLYALFEGQRTVNC